MSLRKVVIFTGNITRSSTIEHVEAMALAFPHWSFTILQEFPPRRWRLYLKNKFRLLTTRPISYPLRLLATGRQMIFDWYRRGRSHGSASARADFACLPKDLASLSLPNVTYRRCSSLRTKESLGFVRDQGFWLGISIGAPILRTNLFTLPELGTINVHKSLLPDYRGLPPGFWELYEGASKSGVSVHWVEKRLDLGDIVCQRELSIPPFATVRGLQILLDVLATEVLLEASRLIDSGQSRGTPQVHSGRPPNVQPRWLQEKELEKRLRRRREADFTLIFRLRQAVKSTLHLFHVYAYAPVRNHLRKRRGVHHTVVLMYHRVNDGYLDPTTVSVEQFDRQLAILNEHYHVLDLEKFQAGKRGTPGRTSVLITFDDGYQDNYLAAILLRRYGLPATFFVSTGIVGTDRPFPHDLQRLGHRVPTLTWKQVEQMARWGFSFGNHTVEHSRVSHLPHEEAMEEIALAKSHLEQHIGAGLGARTFAYPFGKPTDITDEIRKDLPSIGIDFCFSGYGGVNSEELDGLNVLRIGVDNRSSDLNFRAMIEGWEKPG